MRLAPLVLLAAACASCAGVHNYPDPAGPRFAGSHLQESATPALPEAASPVLRVATFNIKFGRRVDRAIDLFRENPLLASADLVLLQEMNEKGVERMADALHVDYVYYPGAQHPKSHGNFGNAILSRWPIEADHKIVLPHPGRFRKMIRIAVGATVTVRGTPIRVYSVHFETVGAISAAQRRDQLAAVVKDAGDAPRVLIAGDFNNTRVTARALQAAGYTWISQGLRHTISRFAWDHVFVRGLTARGSAPATVIRDNHGASDHKPVWAELRLE